MDSSGILRYIGMIDNPRNPVRATKERVQIFTGCGTRRTFCVDPAVEPCTAPSDVLHKLEPSACPLIAPQQSLTWWLTIHVLRPPAIAAHVD
jgi:hypothetical protein